MPPIKKSFNINGDLAQRLDDILDANPGLTLTLIVNKALEAWVKGGAVLNVSVAPYDDKDVDAFMRENSSLMSKLAK